MRINKPKLPLNSTPLRARESQGNYYSTQGTTPNRQQENPVFLGNVSPNKLNATRKPQLQKNQAQMPQIPLHQRRESQPNQIGRPLALLSKRGNECANHQDREGSFKIFIDDEVMIYCQECSNKLAGQGFNMERISQEINVFGAKPILSSRRQEYIAPPLSAQPPMPFKNQQAPAINIQNFQLQIDPSLGSEPRYLELQGFVEDCKSTMLSFDQNLQGFQGIEDHYIQQQQLIQQFYDAMIDYLRHLKGQHVNLIKVESKKFIQIADIESGELEENKVDIETMLSDIAECVNEIVSNVDEESFRDCMSSYNQKMAMFKHRVEEQRSAFEDITRVEQRELEDKLKEFRSTVNDLFGVKESRRRQQTSSAMQGNHREPVRDPPRNIQQQFNTNAGMFGNAMNGGMGGGIRELGGTGTLNGLGGMGTNGLIGAMNGGNQINGIPGVNGMAAMGAMGMGSGLNRQNSSGGVLPKGTSNGPFRNLFCQDQVAQSPQFKNI